MAALVTTGDSESEPLARTVSLEDGRGGALIVRSFGVGRGSQRYQDTGGRPSLVGVIIGNAEAFPFFLWHIGEDGGNHSIAML